MEEYPTSVNIGNASRKFYTNDLLKNKISAVCKLLTIEKLIDCALSGKIQTEDDIYNISQLNIDLDVYELYLNIPDMGLISLKMEFKKRAKFCKSKFWKKSDFGNYSTDNIQHFKYLWKNYIISQKDTEFYAYNTCRNYLIDNKINFVGNIPPRNFEEDIMMFIQDIIHYCGIPNLKQLKAVDYKDVHFRFI